VVPIERIELPTHCLQDSSSTSELNRHLRMRETIFAQEKLQGISLNYFNIAY